MDDSFSRLALREISEQQTRWAELREIDVDAHGATRRIEDNLFEALSARARQAFARDPQSPLGERGKPAELMRLDSTQALVSNLFDYWCERPCEPLSRAIGLEADDAKLEFAPLLPRHAASDALVRAADVLIRSEKARPVAVLADFAEPYRPGGPSRGHMFSGHSAPGVWGTLHGCRSLAQDRAANASRFRRLDVPRLLERGLALSTHFGSRRFRMLQLWYEIPGHASLQMRREIDRFRMRVGGEIDFVSLTWQQFFAQLRAQCGEHLGYAAYAQSRYFPG